MSIARYIIWIPGNSLIYFSQLYLPGKGSRIGWWRGKCKDPPTTADVWLWRQWCGLSLFPRPAPSSQKPPAGGGGGLKFTHTADYHLDFILFSKRRFRAGVLRPYAQFSRLNARNRLKMIKSTNFKAYFRSRLPLNQGEEATASDRQRDNFALLSPASCKPTSALTAEYRARGGGNMGGIRSNSDYIAFKIL
jgi:hypothetical protein